MLDKLLSFTAPHLCFGCRKSGAVLCNNCKYNIGLEQFSSCLSCGRLAGPRGICRQCHPPYVRAFCVGVRETELQRLLDAYKFERVRAGAAVLVDLLDARLPALPRDVIIVPIPTIAPHIRVRGYDHSLLLARGLARRRGLTCSPLLSRATNARQQGANRATRFKQAKRAFRTSRHLQPGTYLLLDDIVTTGATLQYAARVLIDAGATDVWVAAVAHQPSTK